jgi:hypothetical protein
VWRSENISVRIYNCNGRCNWYRRDGADSFERMCGVHGRVGSVGADARKKGATEAQRHRGTEEQGKGEERMHGTLVGT